MEGDEMLKDIPIFVLSPVISSNPAFDHIPLLPPSGTRQPAGHGSYIDLSLDEVVQRVLSVEDEPV